MKKILKVLKKEHWRDLSKLSINRLEPVNNLRVNSYEKNINRKDKVISLSGKWEFKYFRTVMDLIYDIDKLNDKFNPILVPSNWQLHGYGEMHYTDLYYPFTFNPPNIPKNNPTGVYKKIINPMFVAKDESITLRLNGVDSACHVFLNNELIGYTTGSRMVSEFDLSQNFQNNQKNKLVIIVYKWNVTTYIEDQDMWWLSGIFRDVYLIKKPKVSIEDVRCDSTLTENLENGLLKYQLKIKNLIGNDYSYTLRISKNNKEYYNKNFVLNNKISTNEIVIESIKKWNAEIPCLYNLTIELYNQETCIDTIFQKIGFRKIKISEGYLTVNGQRIMIKGVNRHEFNTREGRVVNEESIRKDLEMMKAHNINGIRTAHYPNDDVFYELCDEYGFYVISEADVECHGAEISDSYNQITDNPIWQEVFRDRIDRMVKQHYNHPSIIIWSLGNESGYGSNFKKMYDHCKSIDPYRPVHYECDSLAESADLYSTMYTDYESLAKIGKKEADKPHILCEFAHAMGNGPGGLDSYMDIINDSPRIQGCFVWEWQDQGILTEDEDNNSYYKYGGDFGDKLNNGNFCMDGLVTGNREITPGLKQLKKVYEPFKCEIENEIITIKNKYDFKKFNGVIQLEINSNKNISFSKKIKVNKLRPNQSIEININEFSIVGSHPKIIQIMILEYINGKDELKEITFFEYLINKDNKILPIDQLEKIVANQLAKSKNEVLENSISLANKFVLEDNGSSVTIIKDNIRINISKTLGRITEIASGKDVLLEKGFELQFDRAYTDNDRTMKLYWKKNFISYMKEEVESFKLTENNNGNITFTFHLIASPPSVNWWYAVNKTIIIHNNGKITIAYKGIKKGGGPEYLPRIGVMAHVNDDLNNCSWYGRGPEDSYSDAKSGFKIDNYSLNINQMYFNYPMPQETGNKSDVHYFKLYSNSKKGNIKVTSNFLMNFSVIPYSLEMLKESLHQNELVKSKFSVLNIDYLQTGLGSDSWGPMPQKQYLTKFRDFNFCIFIEVN